MNRPALAVEQMRDARDPPVELDEPRVAVEVEPVPLLAELVRGPVGVAVDGDVRGAEKRERLVEPRRVWGARRACRAAYERAAAGVVRAIRTTPRRVCRTVRRCRGSTIRPLTRDDWPDVARIYAEGLATGVASFEVDVPSWSVWDAGHLRAPRLVAEAEGAVVGWLAASPVSSRDCYRGVVEHSVYVDAACARPGRRQGTARAARRGGSGPRDLDDPDVDHRRERAEPRAARVGRLPRRRAAGADRAARRRMARHRAPRAPAAVGATVRVRHRSLSRRPRGPCSIRPNPRALGAPFGVATRIAPCGRTGAESTRFGLDGKRCLTPISSRRVPSPLRGALGVGRSARPAPEDDAGVVPAEPERVGDADLDLLLPRLVRDVVEVALRVRRPPG